MPRSERFVAIAIAAAALVMRVVAFFHYRFDSDEPQHLHVAWGWTAGLLQYRDLFDNHAPLFHIAAAPLLRLLGERADILLYMRAPMVVLWLIVTLATYAVARHLYDVRIALWSTVLLNVFPPFFLKSLEFRTDNLWNAFWMLAIVVLTLGRRSIGVFFVAGLLLGCALSVSLKTSLLLITLARRWRDHVFHAPSGASHRHPGAPSRRARDRPDHRAVDHRRLLRCTRGVVGLRLLRFRFQQAGHNQPFAPRRVAGPDPLHTADRHHVARDLAVPPNDERALLLRRRHRHLFLTLACFWILISPRDFLPFLPFLSIFIVAAMARKPYFVPAVVTLAIVSLIGIGYYTAWLSNRTREFITMENQLLRLTRPGDLVMDYKGEMIYRRRATYFILEFITRNAIAHGLVADTVPEDLVRMRCHVAQADGAQWPDRARDFMHTYFIDLGRLRASGQWLRDDGTFTIAIPGRYVVITRNGEAGGLLDGTPYRGARALAPGTHTFAGGRERMACLWAPAYARGFSPFHPRDLDF